jgi:hypothetical protein
LTILDFVGKHFGAIIFLVALVACVPLVRTAGEPVADIIKAVIHEFSEVIRGSFTPSALNAVGGVVAFAATVALLSRGPLEILGGQIEGHDIPSSVSIANLAISASVVILIVIYFLVSLAITRPR